VQINFISYLLTIRISYCVYPEMS